MKNSAYFELFVNCNHTEIYQICRHGGVPVSPRMTRDHMISLLVGDIKPVPISPHDVDSWRHGIMGFLLDNWQMVRAQLDCPAKSGNPLSCFNCVDARVISCVVTNPENEHLIQIKRKH